MQSALDTVPKIGLALAGLLFCVYPYGPALQNLGLCLFVLVAAWHLRSTFRQRSWDYFPAPRFILTSMLAFLLWSVFATWISPENHDQEKLAYFIGYLPLILLPWMAG